LPNESTYYNGPSGHTATQVTVGTSNTTVTLTALSSNITINNTSANTIYMSFVSPASTTTSYPIAAAGSYKYLGPAVKTIYLISGTSSVVGVDAY
jgi:hypothetical protein